MTEWSAVYCLACLPGIYDPCLNDDIFLIFAHLVGSFSRLKYINCQVLENHFILRLKKFAQALRLKFYDKVHFSPKLNIKLNLLL